MSKRSLLARSMQSSGLTRLLESFRAKPGILVINHHRIGDAKASRFDRAVFSATTDQLDQQVRYIAKQFPVLCGEELDDLVTSRKPLKRLYVGLTFDDGYLDNYTNAYPVFQSHGCSAMFFLVPTYVGTNTIPWWDAIAYLVRNSPRSSIHLAIPAPLDIDLQGDREDAIYRVLQHYKRADNVRCDEFMAQLQSEAQCELPVTERRFLSWSEAEEMQRGGMCIGSHTFTHRILSQLPEDEQQQELQQSRAELQQKLRNNITTLAYPVGIRTAFTQTTEELALSAGYRLGFSFYGGLNTPQNLRPTNLLRNSVEPDPVMFRNQIAFMTHFGKLPY